MKNARLLVDHPLLGPMNMALDEALLQTSGCAAASPVLRFYAWSPPTISLGYFQDHADYERLPSAVGGLSVVRRTTGGGAILHDLEVTYSLAIPASHPLVVGRPNHLYNLAHEAIIKAIGHGVRLFGDGPEARGDPVTDPQSPIRNPQSAIRNSQSTRRGPFFCFARRHALDVVIDDPAGPGGVSKIAGSAQRRNAGAILQHGSIILDSRYRQQPTATWSSLAGPIDFAEAVGRLTPAFEERLGVKFDQASWSDEELQTARKLEQRYAGDAWTIHRQR